jgi:4-carboxymuconolactone decarboxylase
MRLPLIPPAQLSPEQRSLYEDMHEGISKSFQGFIAMRKDGALIGPWNPWLHEPRIGKPIWDLTKALSAQSSLPGSARQVAIFVIGAHFRAAYEIYAHVAVAEGSKWLGGDRQAPARRLRRRGRPSLPSVSERALRISK